MQNVFTKAIRPTAAIVATEAGTTAVQIDEFQGLAKVVLDSSAVNAGTSTTKIQDSADGTNDWQDVTGLAFTAVATAASHQELLVNADKLRKFVRAHTTMAGGANVQSYSVQLVGKKQST